MEHLGYDMEKNFISVAAIQTSVIGSSVFHSLEMQHLLLKQVSWNLVDFRILYAIKFRK